MEITNFKILSSNSSVDWTGRKVTGAHNGTIGIKEGNLILNDGKLTGGNVLIDTSTIQILDISDPTTNAQFAGHLASADFFAIEKFPTATFEISEVNATSNNTYQLEGQLTIKAITHAASFEAKVENNNNALTLSGKLVIDRTKYDIRFRSGNFFKDLGDTLIHNDFDLDFNITAEAISSARVQN